MDSSQSNKQRAVQFLQLVVSGNIDEAYRQFVDLSGKHHNIYFSAGLPTLKAAMQENDTQFPNKKITVHNVLGDGDLVAVHSHLVLKPGETDMIVVHLFRFKNEKIMELWDCGQAIPPDCPNTDGPF